MNHTEALEEYEKYYKDREKEFSIIFDMCDFSRKKVLEIGSGRWGHFVEKVKEIADITASDISKEELEILKSKFDVETRVFDAREIPFDDRAFDIVFSRWVISHYIDIDKAVREMCRVSRSIVFNILPSGNGDETLAKSIKYPNKKKAREDRIKKIRDTLEENGFKTEERRELIEFVFPDINRLIDTIIAFYDDKPSDKELKSLRNFLLSKKEEDGIHFTQGACFLMARR